MSMRISWKKPKQRKWKEIKLDFKDNEGTATISDMLRRGFDVKIKPKGKKSWEIKAGSIS
ncbi:hypothetical protein KY333_05855 [Candidatus Woesearchaeota archaeon]|nr:hypothetical protein [Candidatus Woesearchaeota archaeon]